MKEIILAGGCFWGVEAYFQRLNGVIKTVVGYTDGISENPTYKEVCAGGTGHFEAIKITFDPAVTNFETLAKLFFEIHNPAQTDGQGPDLGEQYLSKIFYADEEQKQIAVKLIDILKSKGINVATELLPLGVFWPAEDYHQNYYNHKGTVPYCHAYTKRF